MSQKKQKIYLDTSVISALLDERLPERQKQTQTFWDNLATHETHISTLVQQEIKAHPNQDKRQYLIKLTKQFKVLNSQTKEVNHLADIYIKEGIIPKRYVSDALHLAVASVNYLNVLVSWNYKHLVKLETIKKAKSINILKGYQDIDIITPLNL